MQHSGEELIRRYLLGDCSEEERQEIERRMMTDGGFVEQVTLFEEELIDEYVRGMLPATERENFERYFLSTSEGLEQVKFATLLSRYALSAAGARKQALRETPVTAPRRSILDSLRARVSLPGYAFAILAAGFILLTAVLLISTLRLQHQVDGLRAQQGKADDQDLREQLSQQQADAQELREQLKRAQNERDAMAQELGALKTSKEPETPQKKTLTVVLASIRVRGEGENHRLVIEPGVAQVSFHLVRRNDDYPTYRVSLRQETGEELWAQDGVKAQSRNGRYEIQVSLPVSRLASGNYILKVQGAASQGNYEDAGNYYFQVVKR
jgi:hypothetical protein